MPLALSHSDYAHACASAARSSGAADPLHVQVRKAGEVLCGRVVECYRPTWGGEWFKVRTELGVVSASSSNVRLCSGDGRCTCEVSR